MIYLASITAWLAAWGPVAWGAVGIASTVALTFGYFLYKVGKIMPVLEGLSGDLRADPVKARIRSLEIKVRRLTMRCSFKTGLTIKDYKEIVVKSRSFTDIRPYLSHELRNYTFDVMRGIDRDGASAMTFINLLFRDLDALVIDLDAIPRAAPSSSAPEGSSLPSVTGPLSPVS